ncbi:MAG: hypothetical protein IMX05_03010 [Hydrogenibacillus schlegelii]|nr:hypothetical protein [Hydrogenibacillus schlegelii]
MSWIFLVIIASVAAGIIGFYLGVYFMKRQLLLAHHHQDRDVRRYARGKSSPWPPTELRRAREAIRRRHRPS